MKKKMFLAWAFSAIMSMTAWATTVQTVTINGETVSQTVSKITFDDDNVVLHFTDNTEQSADMNGVTIALSKGSATGITKLNTFNYNGIVDGQLCVGNVEKGTALVVYNAQGQQVAAAKAKEGETAINLSMLPAGTYILKAGQQAVKFIKQ